MVTVMVMVSWYIMVMVMVVVMVMMMMVMNHDVIMDGSDDHGDHVLCMLYGSVCCMVIMYGHHAPCSCSWCSWSPWCAWCSVSDLCLICFFLL